MAARPQRCRSRLASLGRFPWPRKSSSPPSRSATPTSRARYPARRAAPVAADPQFQAAPRNVTSLLQSKAATLPSGSSPLSCTTTRPVERRLRLRDNKPSGLPLPSDLVRIASITKAYTDTLLYVLRDAGTVGLDDEPATHLPGFSMRNPYGTAGKVMPATSRAPRRHPARDALAVHLDQHQCAESDVLENLRR